MNEILKKSTRDLYIIGENHPWYHLFHPLFKQLFQIGLEKQKTLIKEINPDTIFVEYCKDWKLEDALKYRTDYLIEVERKCGRELSKESAEKILEESYYARSRFYNELSRNSQLIFLEDRENYKEVGELLTKIERGDESPEIIEEFCNNLRKREEGYHSRIKGSDFKNGVVICGLSHVIRNGEITPWIKNLKGFCNIYILPFDIKDYSLPVEIILKNFKELNKLT